MAILGSIGPLLTLLNKLFDALRSPVQSAVDDEKKKAEDERDSLNHTGRPL